MLVVNTTQNIYKGHHVRSKVFVPFLFVCFDVSYGTEMILIMNMT